MLIIVSFVQFKIVVFISSTVKSNFHVFEGTEKKFIRGKTYSRLVVLNSKFYVFETAKIENVNSGHI